MAHHKIDVRLGEGIKRGSLGQYFSNEFMIEFHVRFLECGIRIAVKDYSALLTNGIQFESKGIGKFGTIVGSMLNSVKNRLCRINYYAEKLQRYYTT